MPCTIPTINVPSGPTGPAIPGFGIAFAPNFSINGFALPAGFPEDLLDLLNSLTNFLTPSGPMLPSLSHNYSKTLFDAIINVMDKFLPYLMLYKFFLPFLNIILCILEIICSLANPFAVVAKTKRLFRVCLPAFLALFPFIALIIMLISLLLLLLKIIQYIIAFIKDFINRLLANIKALAKAFSFSDEVGALAIINKIGLITCELQNLFLILQLFDAIIGVIKPILQLAFSVPPCSDSGTGDSPDNCCSPPVCPSFIKNNDTITGSTGTLLYLREVAPLITGLPSGFPLSFFTIAPIREESWQFYDLDASIQTALYNITSAYDLPPGTKTVFFPTDSSLSAETPTSQVPYLMDLRLFYNPASFHRFDARGPRHVRINSCIMQFAPTQDLVEYNNSTTKVSTGVVTLVGGLAFEDDGTTPININGSQGTLNSFIHLPADPPSEFPPNDGYVFNSIDYTLHIQHEVLYGKSIITLGCIPEVGTDRTFVNTVFGGNAGFNSAALANILGTFPDAAAAQACLQTALAGLTSNISVDGVATFQASTTACLAQLQDAANASLIALVNLGFDQYKSTFTVLPTPQFTSLPIIVQVTLNETNGQNIAAGLPADIGATMASQITANATFGTVSTFTYDGYSLFTAEITSSVSGSGTIQISFNGLPISVATISPTDITAPPSITVTTTPYTFVYSPSHVIGTTRYDESDVNNGGTNG